MNDGPELGAHRGGSDRREAKKARVGEGIAEPAIRDSTNTVDADRSKTVEEASGGEKKRKREDDDNNVPANPPLPSVTSSVRKPKKRRPLVPNAPISSTPGPGNLPPSSAGARSSVDPTPRTTDSPTLLPHVRDGGDQTAGAVECVRKDTATTTQNNILPPGFDNATDLGERQPTPTETVEDSNQGEDLYGPPVRLAQPLRGFCKS